MIKLLVIHGMGKRPNDGLTIKDTGVETKVLKLKRHGKITPYLGLYGTPADFCKETEFFDVYCGDWRVGFKINAARLLFSLNKVKSQFKRKTQI